MSANTALELEDVVFRYQEKGKRNILDHTSLSIPAGTLTVLMGGSGCGKSTLAAVAAGLYPENGGFLEGGTIRLYGQDLKTLDPQKRAAYLTVLFQNPDLQFCMNTLREEMRFCLENIRVPAGEMDARIDRAAAELGIAPLLDIGDVLYVSFEDCVSTGAFLAGEGLLADIEHFLPEVDAILHAFFHVSLQVLVEPFAEYLPVFGQYVCYVAVE